MRRRLPGCEDAYCNSAKANDKKDASGALDADAVREEGSSEWITVAGIAASVVGLVAVALVVLFYLRKKGTKGVGSVDASEDSVEMSVAQSATSAV